uniref:FYVE-type domain-containing protein n=1 Tax=Hyaloperonospora arabidopsidis (strain Emoy2) TaxID=559515 RepID=M4BY73_HYAAE
MNSDVPSSTGGGSGGLRSPEYVHRRPTVASQWPVDVDLDALYVSERLEVDEIVRSASDLSVWTVETRRDNTTVYLHSKNSERLSYSVRAETRVSGSVADVLECLRAVDNSSLREFQKLLHPRNFLDGEVLYAHQADAACVQDGASIESMTLKWLVYSSPKTLGRSKEFCIREYSVLLPNHPVHGNVGVVKFESYDGAAARYGIRGKPDAYSLTVFEPSSYVVQQTPEDPSMVTVTLTFAMRKARGGESISAGVRLTSLRLAGGLNGMQTAVQQALFAPAAFAHRQEWVNDAKRTNCSLCVQSFGMLKRRHHCRICGEVVCSACTVFKMVKGDQEVASKVRVCKACLAKGGSSSGSNTLFGSTMIGGSLNFGSTMVGGYSTASSGRRASSMSTDSDMNGSAGTTPVPNGLGVVGTSIGSTSSLTSNESHSPSNDDPASTTPPTLVFNKGSALSLNDFDANVQMADEAGTSSPPPLHKRTSTVSSQGWGTGYEDRSVSTISRTASDASITSSRKKGSDRRIHYFNEDMEEICMLAMETLTCPMAGIRTEDFELVRYYDGKPAPGLPRSLPTFRRLATRGKPCIVLDVSSDKRISGEKRFTAKLQFFVGIPLLVNGIVVGDLCVADRHARDNIDHKQVEVLNVLGETVTQYMQSDEYQEDLMEFKAATSVVRRQPPTGSSSQPVEEDGGGSAPLGDTKEVAF